MNGGSFALTVGEMEAIEAAVLGGKGQ